ncbi:MAG: sugar phosphate isomerase/epimerase [Acidobacteria bacterium]|nr:MAG: sugar phosphate isomerase/epimerase [Acidobacteriota bacterium]
MFLLNRRHLLGALLGAPFLVSSTPAAAPARKPLLKLSCNLYTFNGPLTKGEMTLPQVIDYCADLGFQAVDPTGYYFPGYPEVPEASYINKIKRQVFLLGLEISGTGVRNNFAIADGAKRKADVEHIKQWIEVAAQLGAPVLRVFAGQQDRGYPAAEIDKWLVDNLRECAEHAARFGVILALQNHRDFIDTSEHLIRILKGVNSPWLSSHLDIGGFRTADPYPEIEAAIPYAVNWQIKENVFFNEKETPTDLRRLFEIIRKQGYRGYLPLETLGSGDPREKIKVFLARVREALGDNS